MGAMIGLLGYWGPDEGNRDQLTAALRRLGLGAFERVRHQHGLEFASGASIVQSPGGSVGALVGVTRGDGSLLATLDAIGPAALASDAADGAYALAWYDARAGRLTLAHDPFGARRIFH